MSGAPRSYVEIRDSEEHSKRHVARLQFQSKSNVPSDKHARGNYRGCRLMRDLRAYAARAVVAQIRVCNGLTALTEVMAFILCNEGDTILSPSPMYSGIVKDTGRRPNVNFHPIHLSSKPGAEGEEPYTLTVEHLERGYQEATQQGKRVRVLSLVNPLNPLGTVYTKPQIREYLQFAKR
eukprot:XP_011667027.1 PREDICTED: probable inactive 1-aminocyclopropane-1-carboxylate synthase-like protein 2 [Strongylocentrotus purpuratus]